MNVIRIYRLLLLVCMGALVHPLAAQTFGNEWINYNQQYFKIPTVEKGIYRITQNDLQAAGFPVASVDPRRIQLFHRGQEQAIFISGEADAIFHSNDYIEFYGTGNDGTQDSLLYYPHSAQPHKYYNLYSDTTSYFLTWRLDNGLGKRMESVYEANINNLPAETYHWDEKLLVLINEYSFGQYYYVGTELDANVSHYDYGEGWTGKAIGQFESIDTTLSPIQQMAGVDVQPRLEVLLAGRNNRIHNSEIFAGNAKNSLRSLGTVQFMYQNTALFTATLSKNDMSSGQLVVRARSNGNSEDNISMSYIRLLYPQVWDAGNKAQKYFITRNNPGNKSYIEIANPAAGTIVYDVTDKHSVKRIGTNSENGKLTAIVPGTAIPRTLLANTTFLPSPALRRVQFRNIHAANHNYLIISHGSLMKPAGGFSDAIQAYAAYRASQAGGSYDTLVVNIDLLMNQFNYGEFSPLAIRRFADFMLKNGKPEHLFLIGRALYPHEVRKSPNRLHWHYQVRDLIPTGGYPGSDVALTAGLNGERYVPAIPTGRINASSPQHVIDYLNKVKEHEASLADGLWRKNLIHLSGGKTIRELQSFKAFLDHFKLIAEGPFLGGKVATLSKKTDNSVELINIAEQVNKGVSLVTFFGHSGVGITDIEIGFASDDLQGYRNKGKYPMILVNGCEAGDIFYGGPSLGQDWILTPDRGAILFLAHSRSGYPSPLRQYSEYFYSTAFADSVYIGKPMGVVQQEVLRRFTRNTSTEPNTPPDLFKMSHAEQLTLQGDPAIRLLGMDKPDYATANDKLFLKSFDNGAITAASDSFQLAIVVSNFGQVSRKSFPISVQRTTGDGLTERHDTVFYPPVYYQDTLYFTIRAKNMNAGGNNKFEVFLDVTNIIDELNENNNTAVLEYFMPAVGAMPLFPREYSVVSQQPVHFIAQSTSPSAETRQFIFELDTTHTFTSPAKRSMTVAARMLPSWTTDLFSTIPSHDSTVYYWRVRYADIPEGITNTWAESSFIYITDSPDGWSQSEFPQFSKSTPQQVLRTTQTNTWEFPEVATQIDLTTYGSDYQAEAYKQVSLMINKQPIIFGGRCGDNTLTGIAFNKSTARPYSVLPSLECGREPYVSNKLSDSDLENGRLQQYIDAVPTGDYVLLFTSGIVDFSNWRDKLAEIGADLTKVVQLKKGYPYIILGKKGAASGSAIEIYADTTSKDRTPNQQALLLQSTLQGRADRGSITSSLIGPASEWGSLFRNVLNSETNSQDKWQLDVIGVSLQGVETTLLPNVLNDAYILNQIDVQQYPYLRLRLHMQDSVKLTPPQLKRWQVIYQGVPEGTINPEFLSADVYQILDKREGEEFSLPFVFHNISERNFTDSLTVQYSVINTDTRKRSVHQFKVKPLAMGDTVRFLVPVKTLNTAGRNTLQVYVNPRVLPEQNYANNLYEVPFNVLRDNIHPVLDVTFDGVRIMDGDIVSPTPLITVSLKDENRVLIRKDTVGMEVYLKRNCDGCTFQRVTLNQANVRWTEAKAGTNDFRLEYQPQQLADGIYTLQVQGSDVTGNISGVQPYRISFEVINKSEITHFYPYPNPFSTNTRFVFTLTGAEVPDQIKIQIMTVTGKVVREITQDELGPIRIGNNISAYAWDGTDEYGDKLANGVYLYRVIVKSNGQAMERRSTNADKAFKKDFGKMYILR